MSTRLSAVVITHNEEAAIERCLGSVAFADERIVIDAESTDATVKRARAAGASVHIRPWNGYGNQKNFGAGLAQSEWVLFIDADEEVPQALQEEIEQALERTGEDFFWIRIVTVFLGKPLDHLCGHNPRLFKKSAGRWTLDRVHEQVETMSGQRISLNKKSAVLAAPLLHYSHATIESYLQKMHQYTSLDAEQMVSTGQHRSGRKVTAAWWTPWYLGGRQLLKLLLYRRGILDGYAGVIWCVLSAYYEYEMGKKFLAETRNLNPKS